MAVTKLEDLSRSSLMQLIELKYALLDSREEDALARLIETSVCVEGKKGRGKTLFAVAACYQMRERFNRHIITVGSKMGLKPEFGAAESMTEIQFKDALAKIQEVVNESEEAAAEAVVGALREKGVDLLYATVVFDEAYKLFDARTPQDKLVRLFGYFMAQQRHYFCTTILLTPNREMVDRRVRQQVDWFGRCYHDDWNHTCTVRLTAGLDTIVFTFSGADDSLHTPYYNMYNTHNLVGYRRSHLDIKTI